MHTWSQKGMTGLKSTNVMFLAIAKDIRAGGTSFVHQSLAH